MNLPDPQNVNGLNSRTAEEYVRAKSKFYENLQTIDPHNFREYVNTREHAHLICQEYIGLEGKTIHNIADVVRSYFSVEVIMQAYRMLNEAQKMICENPATVKVF